MRIREKKWILVGTIVLAILLFSQCLSSNGRDPRGKSYAGSAACVKCHQRICDSYLHTPHYHAAALADRTNIAGSFAKGSNTFVVNDTAKVVMEERNGIPWQVLYVNGREKRAERFDIVFGYAKGQTYLYWKNDRMYQLPISWFTGMQRWTSSPGFPPGMPFFDRPVLERCFECHTSFITQTRSQTVNALDRNSMILNIDCERCHGPAANHVSFHTEFPEEKHGKYIVSYRSLSRGQRIGMCAVCHSGSNNIQLRTIFAFRPGDSLSHFVLPAHTGPYRPDVHGDQVALLTSSKCFKMSDMDCSTCHNTHVDDHGDTARYARLCQNCHTPGSPHFCKLADGRNISFLQRNCTKCHMPEQASDVIRVKAAGTGANTSVYMVNHRIAIYPAESAACYPGYHPHK